MIWPGTTISPPNFLTPSRLPRLSRPLRDEPPAFLCAICRSFLALRTVRAPDPGNAQHGLLLAMTLLTPIIVPPLFLEDDDLVGAPLLDDGGADRGTVQQRRAGRDLGPFADHQHLGEFDRRARFGRKLLDRDDIVLGDLVLLAAGPDHCEHHTRRYGLPRSGRNRQRHAQPPRTGTPRPRAAQYRCARRAVNSLGEAARHHSSDIDGLNNGLDQGRRIPIFPHT